MSTKPQESKFIQMTDDEWFAKYKPIANPTGDSGLHIDDVCYMFETYDPDITKVLEAREVNPACVWTLLDCDDCEVIGDGYHYVNRIGYFITEVPAEPNANYEVMYWKDDEKPDQTDCEECEGTGLDKLHKWPDGSFASCEHCTGYGNTQPEEVADRSDEIELATKPECAQDGRGHEYADDDHRCTHCNAPARRQPVSEKITFGAYECEFEGDYDGDDWTTSCFISSTRRGITYSSSLGVLDDFGTLESDRDGTINVPKLMQSKIRNWAEKLGY